MATKLHVFLISALNRGERSASSPGHYISEEEALAVHYLGDSVGLRAALDAV
jgi:hypothetical protein